MKFSKIKIQKEQTQTKGIEKIDMQRLSDVVALVGKNGSGKTRILDLIENNLFTAANMSAENISFLPESLKGLQNAQKIVTLQKELNLLKEKTPKTQQFTIPIRKIEGEIHSLTVDYQKAVGLLTPQLKQQYLKRIESKEIKQLEESMSGSSFEELLENIPKSSNYNELNLLYKSSLKFFIKLPNHLSADRMKHMDNKKFEETVSYERYKSLQGFVKDLLKKDLTWEFQSSSQFVADDKVTNEGKGIWKFDDRPFDYDEFSDGEKTLFTYALLFFLLNQNKNLNIRENIILIDEPELHLHPDSEIDLIERIRDMIKDKGQLIIATHSINILSMLNYDEIFMVKDGIITLPSQATPGKSLSELMGMEERVDKLADFLSSISTWSYVNFITQCFSNPEIIATANENDPQIETLRNAIREKSNKNSNMLLDFGTGKGRVYQQLKSDNEFINKINYCALEPKEDYHTDIQTLGATEIYKQYTELPEDKFDFVLLCNVLHEIPLEDWEKNLNKIINSLKSDGYLIIIEAKYLTKGEKIEKPNTKLDKIGYLLLDKEEIKELFRLSDLPTSITNNDDGKITGVAINRGILQFVSPQSIQNTVKALEENTLKKIKLIREKEYSQQEALGVGRRMAFLSQQHINAKIAHMDLENRPEVSPAIKTIAKQLSQQLLELEKTSATNKK